MMPETMIPTTITMIVLAGKVLDGMIQGAQDHVNLQTMDTVQMSRAHDVASTPERMTTMTMTIMIASAAMTPDIVQEEAAETRVHVLKTTTRTTAMIELGGVTQETDDSVAVIAKVTEKTIDIATMTGDAGTTITVVLLRASEVVSVGLQILGVSTSKTLPGRRRLEHSS
jgi:hypothetical protein